MAKWSKSPEKPGKGVVATSFSGSFSWALTGRARAKSMVKSKPMDLFTDVSFEAFRLYSKEAYLKIWPCSNLPGQFGGQQAPSRSENIVWRVSRMALEDKLNFPTR
jgi:hypothetical protein